MIAVNIKGFVANSESIEELYNEHGYDVGRYIRGDFLVEIYDISRNITITISDFGGTKCAFKAPPNSTIVTRNSNIIHYQPTIDTKLYIRSIREATPSKSSYDDLFKAIDDAVHIRVPKDQVPIVPLSSGYDSGTIACSLRDTTYDTYSLQLHEDMDILEKRIELVSGTHMLHDEMPSKEEYDKHGFRSEFESSIAHYTVASLHSNKVVLSGLGADEMTSGTLKPQYDVLRIFMERNTEIYDKFNVDLRFPLLDPKIFHEINLLEPQLRRRYKQHFEKYLIKNGYPYTRRKASFTQ